MWSTVLSAGNRTPAMQRLARRHTDWAIHSVDFSNRKLKGLYVNKYAKFLNSPIINLVTHFGKNSWGWEHEFNPCSGRYILQETFRTFFFKFMILIGFYMFASCFGYTVRQIFDAWIFRITNKTLLILFLKNIIYSPSSKISLPCSNILTDD
jgi:hypothetical protein